MNDLFTRSFLSYAEVMGKAQKDLEAERSDELGEFFQEVNSVKDHIKEIANLISNLENLNQISKSDHPPARDLIESAVLSILHKAKVVQSSIHSLEHKCTPHEECDVVERTRITVINGLRIKLRDNLNHFQFLRERTLSHYAKNSEENQNQNEQNDAVLNLRRSLTRLHQVFLDMAVLVDSQGEGIEDIEENMANARQYIAGGTDGLHYANQMKKKRFSLWWVWLAIFILFLVCIILSLAH